MKVGNFFVIGIIVLSYFSVVGARIDRDGIIYCYSSSDTDGGNVPLTAGTCTRTRCEDCASPCTIVGTYADTCSANTLTEYYVSGTLCASTTYDCPSYCTSTRGSSYTGSCSSGACNCFATTTTTQPPTCTGTISVSNSFSTVTPSQSNTFTITVWNSAPNPYTANLVIDEVWNDTDCNAVRDDLEGKPGGAVAVNSWPSEFFNAGQTKTYQWSISGGWKLGNCYLHTIYFCANECWNANFGSACWQQAANNNVQLKQNQALFSTAPEPTTTTTSTSTTTTTIPTNCYSSFWNTWITNGNYCCQAVAAANPTMTDPSCTGGTQPCYISCPTDAQNGWQCVNGQFVSLNPTNNCPYVGATQSCSVGSLSGTQSCSSTCSWLSCTTFPVLSLSANPPNIDTIHSSTITATTGDSKSGIVISFSTTLGSLNPSSCTTSGGSCTVSFSSSNTGTATITASASNYNPGSTSVSIVLPSTISVTLYNGWNLISVPFKAITSISDNCGIATKFFYYFNAQTNNWEQYTAYQLTGGKGYWIYLDSISTCTVTFNGGGSVDTADLPHLKAGYNLVGPKSVTPYSFSSTQGSCSVSAGPFYWDTINKKWTVASTFEAIKGYWVYVNSDCSFV